MMRAQIVYSLQRGLVAASMVWRADAQHRAHRLNFEKAWITPELVPERSGASAQGRVDRSGLGNASQGWEWLKGRGSAQGRGGVRRSVSDQEGTRWWADR